MAITASAYAQLTSDPMKQEIPVGGNGSYILNLTTDYTGAGGLGYLTDNSSVSARLRELPSGTFTSLGQSGGLSFTSTGGSKLFELDVHPQSGVQIRKEYNISVYFLEGTKPRWWNIKAVVTAGVVPVPELATVVLISAGLVGLVGIRKRYK